MNHLDGKMKSVKVDTHILSDKFLLISCTINLRWTKERLEKSTITMLLFEPFYCQISIKMCFVCLMCVFGVSCVYRSGATHNETVQELLCQSITKLSEVVVCSCQCFAGWQARCLEDCVVYNIHEDLTPVFWEEKNDFFYEQLKVLFIEISMNVNESVSLLSGRVKGGHWEGNRASS